MAKVAKCVGMGLSNPTATVAGLFIVLVVFHAFTYVWHRLHPASQQDPRGVAAAFTSMAITWAITLLVLAVVVFWERQGLASIGLGRPKLAHVAWGLTGFAVGGVLFLLTKPLIEALGLVDVQVRATKLSAFPIWIAIPGILTNAFTEEIMFRGYMIERLAPVTGHLVTAGVIAWLIFAAGHYFGWGLGSALQIGLWAVVVTAIYITQRSLWPCIVMHAVNNFVGLVVLPRLSRS